MRKIVLGGKNLLPPVFTIFITLFRGVFLLLFFFFFLFGWVFLKLDVNIVDKKEEIKISRIIQNENKAKMGAREEASKMNVQGV